MLENESGGQQSSTVFDKIRKKAINIISTVDLYFSSTKCNQPLPPKHTQPSRDHYVLCKLFMLDQEARWLDICFLASCLDCAGDILYILYIVLHTHNCFKALWILSGTTRVSWYHSPTHTHRGHQISLSASSIYYDPWHPPYSIHVLYSLFSTISLQVFFALPLHISNITFSN